VKLETKGLKRFGSARGAGLALLGMAALAAIAAPAHAQSDTSFLAGLHKNTPIGSTVPANGDQNPYAMFVVPESAGALKQGNVLISNFNNKGNLQGVGSTLMQYDPSTQQITQFAAIPQNQPGCPGGIGLTTALAVLKSGWVLIGSLPSTDGTTKTKGPGCLVVLDNQGKVAGTIAGANINGPWGNIALVDRGSKAVLFVSNTGFGVGAPGQPVVNQATVLRINLSIPKGKPPVVTKETVIADGLGEQADANVFIIGPTGLALDKKSDTLYVSDALGNRIVAIPDALKRKDSAGTGKEIFKGGDLSRPLALIWAPNGNLITTNGLNGKAIEINPATGKQVGSVWFNTDKAQTPPGSGDLFGLVLSPDGKGVYYVADDNNTLDLMQ
jgi:hypothetical protein